MSDEGREARVRDAVGDRKRLVDRAIDEELPVESPERLYEASRYLLEAGGKRLRPTIYLLAAEAVSEVEPLTAPYREFPDTNGEAVDVMAGAVSIEIIHLFTLIHDDIMDDDRRRRGVPTVHREYDLETAILAGDTLYSKAFEIMLGAGAPPERTVRALRELAETCTEICEGQSLDVGFERRDDVGTEEYLDMIEHKTAALYGAAAAVPGILLDADAATVEALHRYGTDVGRAFQIQDDVLDLVAPGDRLGKDRASDLIEGKRTLVTVHAGEQGIDVDGLVDPDPTDEEIDAAVARLDEAGSIDYAREMARDLIESGKDHLRVLPETAARDLLFDISDFLIEREY